MKKKTRKIWLIALASALLLGLLGGTILLISGGSQPFTGKIAAYCDSLVEAGFPEDYAVSLTKLHLLHPSWEFVPLRITEETPQYTWDYVISKETENPKTNLISAADSYSDYRHPLNRELYDAGFYQPSTAAVEYFMDPRNFLNEADIFQFYDLSGSENHSLSAVKAVLEGTFLEGKRLENGMLCGDYLVMIGEEIGIDPVYLAVKLRQEQGIAGTSPIISGSCGDLLWKYYREQTQSTENGKPVNPPAEGETEEALTSLNGLYNPFNVGAGGTGVFQIYKNAMNRAVAGTPEQVDSWGSAEWNTLWKGLYGGALFIKEKYIDRYQSTIYLQKFNVDGRIPENNFWSQYMQNLTGALTEGRTFFRSYAEKGSLDAPCRFLIPVYGEMPTKVSEDPADGDCLSTTPASYRYNTTALLSSPELLRATDDGIYGSASVQGGKTLTVSGLFTHSYGIDALQYSIDGGEWLDCSDNGTLSLSFSENLPAYGEHILVIRARVGYDPDDSSKKHNAYSLCAALNLTVVPPPSVKVTLQSGSEISETMHYEGDLLQLPVCEDESFAGWLGINGELLPSGYAFQLRQDVSYRALFLNFQLLEGAALSLTDDAPTLRFYATLPAKEYLAIKDSTRFYGVVNDETEASVHVRTLYSNSETPYCRLSVTTPSWEQAEDAFTVTLHATVSYPDGSEKTVTAMGEPTVRTPLQVALAALEDTHADYTEEERAALQSIIS